MARDMESLYAAVKALSGVLNLNMTAKREMERKRGYQLLALCLRRHKHMLNAHILHIILDLVITTRSVEAPSIPDSVAFNDLICELNVCIFEIKFIIIKLFLISYIFSCGKKFLLVFYDHFLNNYMNWYQIQMRKETT